MEMATTAGMSQGDCPTMIMIHTVGDRERPATRAALAPAGSYKDTPPRVGPVSAPGPPEEAPANARATTLSDGSHGPGGTSGPWMESLPSYPMLGVPWTSSKISWHNHGNSP